MVIEPAPPITPLMLMEFVGETVNKVLLPVSVTTVVLSEVRFVPARLASVPPLRLSWQM